MIPESREFKNNSTKKKKRIDIKINGIKLLRESGKGGRVETGKPSGKRVSQPKEEMKVDR